MRFLRVFARYCTFFVFSLQKRVYNIQKQVKYRYTGWQHHRMAVLTDGEEYNCKVISQQPILPHFALCPGNKYFLPIKNLLPS